MDVFFYSWLKQQTRNIFRRSDSLNHVLFFHFSIHGQKASFIHLAIVTNAEMAQCSSVSTVPNLNEARTKMFLKSDHWRKWSFFTMANIALSDSHHNMFGYLPGELCRQSTSRCNWGVVQGCTEGPPLPGRFDGPSVDSWWSWWRWSPAEAATAGGDWPSCFSSTHKQYN